MTRVRLVIANLRHNRLRTILTAAAIATSITLVTVLLTMPEGLNSLIDDVASNSRISVHSRSGLFYPLPYSFVHKVRQLQGAEAVVSMTWFGGAYEESGRLTFPTFALEPADVFAVYPDYAIAEAHAADFQRYRDAALVGRPLMRRYGWSIGQRVTLRSMLFPLDLDFRIVGEIADDRLPLFWLSRTYLDEALKSTGGPGLGIADLIWVRVGDPARVNSLMLEIQDMSRNSDSQAMCETEKSFFANFLGSLESVANLMLVVTGLIVLSTVFITANTASMNIRERTMQLATLRAIGFRRRALFALLVSETVGLAAVSGVVGVALAFGFTKVLRAAAGWNNDLNVLGSFVLTPRVALTAGAFALLVGLLAGSVPAGRALRRPLHDALRDVF